MVAGRIARPHDELLDVLVAAWTNGRITDRELLGYLYGFVAAGTDTTGTSFVNAFSLLDEFDLLDYARNILNDDDALRCLVEETLRYGTPFPTKPIFVLEECEFGELTIPAGSVVNIWFAAANRDKAVNGGKDQSDPADFDPHRSPNRHLGLGWAKHFCLGADLARLEIRILLQEGLRRLPELRMDRSKPFTRYAGIVDGVTAAPFTFNQNEAERIMRSEHKEGTQ